MWAKYNIFLFGFLLCSCSLVTEKDINTTLKAGVEIPMIGIAINNSGNLVISVSPSLPLLPTPLGNFGAFVEAEFEFVDPSAIFPDKQMLTLQTEQDQWVYDLHEQQFQVTLDNVDATIINDGKGNILVVFSPSD